MPLIYVLRCLALLLFLATGVPAARAQAPAPPADAADVASLDALVAALYDVISGPADAPRDWDRFRSLLHPEARLAPLRIAPDTTHPVLLAPAAFAEDSERAFREAPLFQGKGFYEREVARRVETWGRLAHLWSTYESRLDPSEAPFSRGINSIQAYWDGERWWILHVLWQQESEEAPLPARYLAPPRE